MRQINCEVTPATPNVLSRKVNKVDLTAPFSLSRGSLWSRRLSGMVRLRCLQGAVWITKDHDAKDYFLRAGEHIELSGGHPIVEALQNAVVEIEDLSNNNAPSTSVWHKYVRHAFSGVQKWKQWWQRGTSGKNTPQPKHL